MNRELTVMAPGIVSASADATRVGVTGDFMTRNFAFYVKPIPLKCLGVPPTGNFGSARRVSIIRAMPNTNLCAILLRLLLSGSLFPGCFVGNSTGAMTAQAAILSTNVSNVA